MTPPRTRGARRDRSGRAERGGRCRAPCSAVGARLPGADVRSALDRLEIVDSALATCGAARSRGGAPATRVCRRLAWTPPERSRPRGTVAAGHRRDRGLATFPWRKRWLRLAERMDRALGPPSEGWEGRRRRRVVANLVAVRRDLGLEGTDRARAVNGGPSLDPAMAAVLARGTSDGSPSAPRLRDGVQLGPER